MRPENKSIYAKAYVGLKKYAKAYNIFQTGLPLKLLPIMAWNRPTAEAQPIQPGDGTQTGTDDPSAYTLRASCDLRALAGRVTAASLQTDVGYRAGNTSLFGQTSWP